MIVIGRHEFKTQTEALEYTRMVARRCGDNSIIKTGEDFEYLNALLQRHPEYLVKMGCGVIGFRVVTNFGGYLAFNLIRIDGKEEGFSFISCVKAKGRPSKYHLHEAMRQSIVKQVQGFKEFKANEFRSLTKRDGFKCNECKCAITRSVDAHVDHVIEFSQIRDRFLEGRLDLPTTFCATGNHLPQGFMPCDLEFSMEWQRFHSEGSILRILCSECNGKRLTKNLMKNAIAKAKEEIKNESGEC